MEIRYVQGDYQIGDIVKMVLDDEMKGMVTGIQFRDKSFLYMVTWIVDGRASETFHLAIELKRGK